jgi:hypothetical protein
MQLSESLKKIRTGGINETVIPKVVDDGKTLGLTLKKAVPEGDGLFLADL